MKMIKKVLSLLVVSSSLFFVYDSVSADSLFPGGVAAMNDEQRVAEKYAKGEAQRALALSKRPEVVGEEILEQEADGQFALSQEALDNWANGRMFPAPLNKK